MKVHHCVKCGMPAIASFDMSEEPIWWCSSCNEYAPRTTWRKKVSIWWKDSKWKYESAFKNVMTVGLIGTIVFYAWAPVTNYFKEVQDIQTKRDNLVEETKRKEEQEQVAVGTYMVFYGEDGGFYCDVKEFVSELKKQAVIDGVKVQIVGINLDARSVKLIGSQRLISEANAVSKNFKLNSIRLANETDN